MKSLKLYLIVAAVLLVIYIIAQFNRPKIIDWSESFSDKEKTPFGTYIVYNRLKDIFPKSQIMPYRQPIYSVIDEDLQILLPNLANEYAALALKFSSRGQIV